MHAGQTAYLAACISGVWVTWTAHDYLQERIFNVPGFHFGLFMSFSLQTVSCVLSLVYSTFVRLLDSTEKQRRDEEERAAAIQAEEQEEKVLLDTEEEEDMDSISSTHTSRVDRMHALAWYLMLSLLIAAANGSATASLNFVSMQLKILFKSAKIVTVMLIGRLCFGRLYDRIEYMHMFLVVLGLVAFLLASRGGAPIASLVGTALLCLAILADSLVPNVQQRLLTTLKRPMHELVFHTNWVRGGSCHRQSGG